MRMHFVALFSCLMAIVTSCSFADDSTYLTPIPKATISAYTWDTPVSDKLQAVIYARAMLNTSRLQAINDPQVLLAEETTLDNAKKQRLAQPAYEYEDRQDDTYVWLVVFEGTWQLFPPDPEHVIAPELPFHACVLVIIDKKDSTRIEMGTAKCTLGK